MRSTLARLGVGAALVAGVTLLPSPSYAELGNGCAATAPAAVPGATDAASCSYIAGGPGAYSAAAVPNWLIRVNGEIAVQGGTNHPGTPAAGTLATEPGDAVHVEIFSACSPLDPNACGAAGQVSAGDIS